MIEVREHACCRLPETSNKHRLTVRVVGDNKMSGQTAICRTRASADVDGVPEEVCILRRSPRMLWKQRKQLHGIVFALAELPAVVCTFDSLIDGRFSS